MENERQEQGSRRDILPGYRLLLIPKEVEQHE